MKIEKCKKHKHTSLRVPCCKCNCTQYIEYMYADLDGKPFESYYCVTCKNDLEQ